MKALAALFILLPSIAFASWQDYALSLKPNAAAIDFLNNKTFVYLVDRETLTTSNKSGAGVLGAFSVTTLNHEDPGFNFHWRPVFSLASHRAIFNTPAVFLSQTDFHLFGLFGGIGPEIGYTGFLGTVSLGISFGYGYNYVSWSSPLSGGSMGRYSGKSTVTISYYKYLADKWAVQWSVRAITEDAEVWSEALKSSQGFPVPVESVSNNLSGISIIRNF